jgi:hypothetical protein
MHGHINVKFVYEAYYYSYMMANLRRALLDKRPLAAFRHSMPCFCNRSL